MPRRSVVKKLDVLRRRALAWEQHYSCRALAKDMALDPARVVWVIRQCVQNNIGFAKAG